MSRLILSVLALFLMASPATSLADTGTSSGIQKTDVILNTTNGALTVALLERAFGIALNSVASDYEAYAVRVLTIKESPAAEGALAQVKRGIKKSLGTEEKVIHFQLLYASRLIGAEADVTSNVACRLFINSRTDSVWIDSCSKEDGWLNGLGISIYEVLMGDGAGMRL